MTNEFHSCADFLDQEVLVADSPCCSHDGQELQEKGRDSILEVEQVAYMVKGQDDNEGHGGPADKGDNRDTDVQCIALQEGESERDIDVSGGDSRSGLGQLGEQG